MARGNTQTTGGILADLLFICVTDGPGSRKDVRPSQRNKKWGIGERNENRKREKIIMEDE
jgi:hypothetical protein